MLSGSENLVLADRIHAVLGAVWINMATGTNMSYYSIEYSCRRVYSRVGMQDSLQRSHEDVRALKQLADCSAAAVAPTAGVHKTHMHGNLNNEVMLTPPLSCTACDHMGSMHDIELYSSWAAGVALHFSCLRLL